MEHDRILGYFLEEAIEHLHTIEQGLLKLPETVKQPATIRELFRAAHSIKGSAAMLGLRDIQKVADRFESNFKLLKEHPQIAVDNQLKSLFLESFGFRRAGIEEVRVSSDPYRQDPDTPNPIGDPVFEELRSYLQQLLADTEPTVPESTDRERDPAIDRIFGEYVTNKLAELLELCLQIDIPETRTQIQQICQKLGKLGENFEYLEWTNLFAACRLAIANPGNSLHSLGETLAIAIKQAQVLVLADRPQAITITPDLEAAIAPHLQTAGAQTQGTNNTTAALSVDSANGTTWNLDDRPADSEQSTYQLQQPPELVSLSAGFNSDISNFSAMSEAEFDTDAMELNEFMNLLSDDMPTEGSWIQDEDFFDTDCNG
jgi:chemotaxis protein histidine kinase CheA